MIITYYEFWGHMGSSTWLIQVLREYFHLRNRYVIRVTRSQHESWWVNISHDECYNEQLWVIRNNLTHLDLWSLTMTHGDSSWLMVTHFWHCVTEIDYVNFSWVILMTSDAYVDHKILFNGDMILFSHYVSM